MARLVTRVENESPAAQTALAKLYPHTGRAHIVGITGPPGCGKSTLVNQIAKQFRRKGDTVGIVAVDPTSPFSGGAVLGARIRMRDLAGDEGIFIRSMASRGSLGGLARATDGVIKLLDAAGFDIVLVETVGAGQSEVDIAKSAHTTVVVQAQGMGDDIQAIKAGILEIADVFAVNKADRPGAENTVKALQMMQRLGANGHGNVVRHHGTLIKVAPSEKVRVDLWKVPIVMTVGLEGQGVKELVAAVREHRTYLHESGLFQVREAARVEREFERLLRDALLANLLGKLSSEQVERTLEKVLVRDLDPYTAVDQLVSAGLHAEG